MTDLITFIIIAYGASNIMVFSSLFEKWRKFWKIGQDDVGFFGSLFGCMMCLPFWWGVILSITMHSPSFAMNGDEFMILNIPYPFIDIFFDGCLASGSVWLLHTLQEKLERE